jgi:hypothetical protein
MQEDALPNLYNFTVASLVQLSFSRRVLCHSYIRCVFTYFGSVSSFLTTRVDNTGMPKGVDISHASVTNALLLDLASLGVDCKISQGEHVLADLATATAPHLYMAVLMRSEPVVNLLFTVFCSVLTSFPPALRLPLRTHLPYGKNS